MTRWIYAKMVFKCASLLLPWEDSFYQYHIKDKAIRPIFLKPSLVCLGSVREKRVETLKTLAFWRGAWRETHLFNRESRLGQMQTTSLVLVQPRLTLARQEPSIDVRAWRAWRRKAIYALSYPLFSCAYNRPSFPFSFNQ